KPYPLAGNNVAARLVPACVEVVARDALARHCFDPFRLDACGTAREKACRLRELRGDDPFRRLLREARSRMQEEPDAARAVVLAAHRNGGLRFHADVAEQSREQRAVDRFIT